MARTYSTMTMAIGSLAPDFTLMDVVTGAEVSMSGFIGQKAILVIFLCRHCPFVKHLQEELGRLAKEYMPRGRAVIGISSNDAVAYPMDSPESLKEFAQEQGYEFPICFDGDQAVARSYDAACTPDFFLFDSNHRLTYRGQFDDSRPSLDIPVTGKDLKEAIEATMSGHPCVEDQKPSLGCNIKWKS